MHTIEIQQWSTLLVSPKGTILDAALNNGVPYPHSCRVGECGNCKTRLLKGEVNHDSYCSDALSTDEREQGLILACRARPKTDIGIAWNDDIEMSECTSARQLQATVISIELVAPEVSKLRLETDGEPLAFAAGQYARLSMADLPARS